MDSDLELEIDLVITDFTIAEVKKSKFTNYGNFCDFISSSLRANKMDLVIEYIQRIVNGCNDFFGFGDDMYAHVFDFFLKQRYNNHYELIKLIISIYGYYIK